VARSLGRRPSASLCCRIFIPLQIATMCKRKQGNGTKEGFGRGKMG
jgi:hypothetical protein